MRSHPALALFAVLVAVVLPISRVRAEAWPSLDSYVRDCTLIVKAKTVTEHGHLTFRVVETWRGTYDPTQFVAVTTDGRFYADQGEHGVDVVDGQEIVFFFTRRNQSDPKKLSRHSAAFPIVRGTVVYARTSEEPETFKVDAFKQAIVRAGAAKRAPNPAPR